MLKFYDKLKNSFIENQPSLETELLIENVGDIKDSLLQYIVKKNEIALLKLIIEKRPEIDLNVADPDEKTLLLLSLYAANYELATILINSGANVNLADGVQLTPLHFAVYENNCELAATLIDHQANINAQLSGTGETPLMILCEYTEPDIYIKDMLNVLLIGGADVNICNKLGETAIVQYLKEYDRISADNILQIIEHGCNLEDVDRKGNTLLHLAVASNYKSVVHRLLIGGVNLDSLNSTDSTALHIAVKKNDEMACMLLYYGANANYIDKDNNSTLINSLRLANYQLSELLFFSYDGLNGDDCHKVFFTILENPLAHKIDMPILVAMLHKFQEFVTNTKTLFDKYKFSYLIRHSWPIHNRELYEAVAYIIIHFNNKLKNYNLTEYLDFDSTYYCHLVSLGSKNCNVRAYMLKLIWNSLSMGITCTLTDLVNAWEQFGLQKEIFALIWGSFHQNLVDNIKYLSCFSSPMRTWNSYLKLLHRDVRAGTGQLAEHLEKHLAKQLLTRHKYFYANYKTMFSSKDQVKTLAELSRDKARTFIMQQFKTKTFYDVHEIVNNLNLPQRIKGILQFKIKLNCNMCGLWWCRCD